MQEPTALTATNEEGIYFTIEYEFDSGVKIDSRDILDSLEPHVNAKEHKAIVDALNRLEHTPVWNNDRAFSYTLAITREELDKAGGVAYLSDVDIVVGYKEHQEVACHPYSQQGQIDRMNESLDHREGLHQRIIVVDSAAMFGPRWVNTGQGIYEVQPIQDGTRQDGVYVTSYSGRHKEPKTEFYTHDEAEDALGLYISRAQAEAYGSPEKRWKSELQERERALQEEKVNFTEAKQRYDREKSELERERASREEYYRDEEARRKREQADLDERSRQQNAEVDRQREALRLERERIMSQQKFDQELFTRDRKDQSERLKAMLDAGKALLGIVSVGLSIYALAQKNAPKKTS